MRDRSSQAAGAKKKAQENSVGGGNKSVQELECIALKGDISTVVQRLRGARDFGRVEFLVLVRRERCIHVCDKCGDRQGIRGGIRRTEEVGNRVACEVKPMKVRHESHPKSGIDPPKVGGTGETTTTGMSHFVSWGDDN